MAASFYQESMKLLEQLHCIESQLVQLQHNTTTTCLQLATEQQHAIYKVQELSDWHILQYGDLQEQAATVSQSLVRCRSKAEMQVEKLYKTTPSQLQSKRGTTSKVILSEIYKPHVPEDKLLHSSLKEPSVHILESHNNFSPFNVSIFEKPTNEFPITKLGQANSKSKFFTSKLTIDKDANQKSSLPKMNIQNDDSVFHLNINETKEDKIKSLNLENKTVTKISEVFHSSKDLFFSHEQFKNKNIEPHLETKQIDSTFSTFVKKKSEGDTNSEKQSSLNDSNESMHNPNFLQKAAEKKDDQKNDIQLEDQLKKPFENDSQDMHSKYTLQKIQDLIPDAFSIRKTSEDSPEFVDTEEILSSHGKSVLEHEKSFIENGQDNNMDLGVLVLPPSKVASNSRSNNPWATSISQILSAELEEYSDEEST